MKRYLFHRLLALLPVLLVVSVVVFCLIHLAPGDPALVILGNDASPADIAAMRQQMGLDRPLLVQFVSWFGGILTGDLGHSLFLNTSVMTLFLQHLTPTLALALYAQAIALVLGLLGGVVSAWQHGGVIDKAIRALATLGMSVPGFLLGLFLIFFLPSSCAGSRWWGTARPTTRCGLTSGISRCPPSRWGCASRHLLRG
jgi:peptide/nickel transport system permease protein